MNKQEIDNIICAILFYDGPDRHIDGHGVITDFIEALLAGYGEEWTEAYTKLKQEKEEAEWRAWKATQPQEP